MTRDELFAHRYHPRILELRLAGYKMQLENQYGEAQAIEILQKLSDMFQCNWSLLVGIFNKSNRIMNYAPVSVERKKQEVILMGYMYDETRYYIAKHYLGMSVSYLYQMRYKHNPEEYVDEQWIKDLDEEIMVCGVRSHATEAKRFIISFDSFVSVFK